MVADFLTGCDYGSFSPRSCVLCARNPTSKKRMNPKHSQIEIIIVS
jgi:hypothetical protein